MEEIDNEDGFLKSIKVYLRINHNKLDDEIKDTIEAGKEELRRVGISEVKSFDTSDVLIKNALKVWCQMNFTSDANKYNTFSKSWQYQIDNLRKSRNYERVDNSV